MRAGRGFIQCAQRQKQPLELSGGQLGQRVGLIFGVSTAKKVRAIGPPLDACVVSGRHEPGAEPVGVLRERSELDEVVARNARVRRSAGSVVFDKTVDDV